MTKETEPQLMGGRLEIPDGWCVYHADFDGDKPHIVIIPGHSSLQGEETRLEVPRALAYYLRTHFCGSHKMRDQLIEAGRAEVRNAIKDVLKITTTEKRETENG